MYYYITTLFYIQPEISTSSWPQDGYWPQLMEDFKISYKSKIFNEPRYTEAIINGRLFDDKNEYATHLGSLKKYPHQNFAKVQRLHLARNYIMFKKILCNQNFRFIITV